MTEPVVVDIQTQKKRIRKRKIIPMSTIPENETVVEQKTIPKPKTPKKRIPKPTETKESKPILPRMVKGSNEAKEHMAKLRGLKKKKK